MRSRKGFQISIRSGLVLAFLVSSLFIATVAIGLQYIFNKNLATAAKADVFQQTAVSTADYITAIDQRISAAVNLIAQSLVVLENRQDSERARNLFAEMMLRNPSIHSIYMADKGGYYEALVNLDAAENLRQQLQAETADRWVRIIVTGQGSERIRRFEYLDSQFTVRHRWQHASDFSVENRQWYSEAKAETVVKSQRYLLQQTQIPGQTYSTRISATDTVLGVDVGLSSLQTFINSLSLGQHTEVYLYQQNGERIASNQPTKAAYDLPAAPSLILNSSQQALVDELPFLLVSNETNWPPINFAVAGEPRGYAIDVLSYISEMISVPLRYINGLSWRELASLFVSYELDIIQPVYFSEYRDMLGEMTHPFLQVPYGIVTLDATPIEDISTLNGKTIAVPEGWSVIDYLQQNLPDSTIIEVPSLKGIFEALQAGEADAGVDAAVALSYLRDQYAYDAMTVHTDIDFSDIPLPDSLHFLVNRDHPGLVEIINLAITTLERVHLDALDAKWFESSLILDSDSVPFMDLLRTNHLQPSDSLQRISRDDTPYFVYHQLIENQYGENELFTVFIPQDSVIAPALEDVSKAAIITALIILLLLPLSWLFATAFIKPLKRLAENNTLIGQRRFAEIQQINSRFSEFNQLDNSMITMADAVQTHEQAQQKWIEDFIEQIAKTIEDKSTYTADHSARFPELAFMLAEKADQSSAAAFADFNFDTAEQWREFRLGAWLHDCGKIITPQHLVDKGSKLETVFNRIHEIRMRFEVLWRDAEINYLKQVANLPDNKDEFKQRLTARQQQLKTDFSFIAECNLGSEFMDTTDTDRLHQLASETWVRQFDDRLGLSPVEAARYQTVEAKLPVVEQLLSDKPEHIMPHQQPPEFDAKLGINIAVPKQLYHRGELHNLSVTTGTLTEEERFKVNEHIIKTIQMLERLPFPDELARVPRYASTYHESLTGGGYPRGVAKVDLSIAERILMLADIFEGLTASDKPYKKTKPLSVSLTILHRMVEKQQVDRDLFELFLTSGIYMQYAKRFLPESQIDMVDITPFLSAKGTNS